MLTMGVNALIIFILVRGAIFDALGLLLLTICGFYTVFCLYAFIKIILLANNNHILKTRVSKEIDDIVNGKV